MSTLDDIRARWAEYNTGAHQVDWYIDRGLALASDVGTLLAEIDRQQDHIANLDKAAALLIDKYEEQLDRQQTRITAMEYDYESMGPGTQGAMLEMFYALLPTHTITSSVPAPELLRRHLDRQQAVIDAARAIDARCTVRLVGAGLALDTTPGFHEALRSLHEALDKLDALDTSQSDYTPGQYTQARGCLADDARDGET